MTNRSKNFKHLMLTDQQALTVQKRLSGLRKDDRFCDLGFVCTTKSKSTIVFGHKAVLMPLSSLITELAEIAYKKQLGETMYVSLPDVDHEIVEKLMSCIYDGQSLVSSQQKEKLLELVTALDLSVNFAGDQQNGTRAKSPSHVEDKNERLKREALESTCKVLLTRLNRREISNVKVSNSSNRTIRGDGIGKNSMKTKVIDESESNEPSDSEDEPLARQNSRRDFGTKSTSTSGIECCKICAKVFIGIDACKRHMEEFHKSGAREDSDRSSSPVLWSKVKQKKSDPVRKKRSAWDDDDEDADESFENRKNSKKKPKMSRLTSKLTTWNTNNDDGESDQSSISDNPPKGKNTQTKMQRPSLAASFSDSESDDYLLDSTKTVQKTFDELFNDP